MAVIGCQFRFSLGSGPAITKHPVAVVALYYCICHVLLSKVLQALCLCLAS